MPAISKIRFTNVIYENGAKRYNDEIFQFDGYNGVLVLENGGGKTVFIQAAIQAILPHQDVADRKIRESLSLEGSPCHIAIEWILSEKPRRYLLTAVTLFISSGKLESYKYVYEYGENDDDSIENIPFTQKTSQGDIVTDRGRINEYYLQMKSKNMNARKFDISKDYHKYIEEDYKIIASEWRSIVRINNDEGGVEGYFDNCKTTSQLVDKLLIPVIEDALPGDSLKEFSDVFEGQRERFKKHKQIRETIDQSKQLEAQIEKYIDVFSSYNDCDKEFIERQEYAKAIYQYAKKEKTDIDNEILSIEEDINTVIILRKELERKNKSYGMAVLKEQAYKHEEEFRQVEKIYNEINDEYKNICSRLENLNIAKIRKRIEQSKDTILSKEKYIKVLESEQDVKDINNMIKKNSSKIRGYFLREEEQLKNQKSQVEREHLEARQDYDNGQKDFNQLSEKQKKIEGQMNLKKGRLDGVENEMQETLKEIVVINESETIKEQQNMWSEKASEINKLISDNENQSRNLLNEKERLKDELNTDRQDLKYIDKEIIRKKDKIKKIDKDNNLLLVKFKENSQMFPYMESIYANQESVLSYMERQFKILNREKEDLFLEERKSGRLKDDYTDIEHFTVEPLVSKWIGSWKNQFNYIETGTQYIQRVSRVLEIQKDDIANKYPYWTVSVIVEDREVEKLKDLVYKNREKITWPILILGEVEANSIIRDGKQARGNLVLPSYWEDNTDQEFFENWKQENEKNVNEITIKRRQKENEISEFSTFKGQIEIFFKNYTYEYYKSLKEDFSKLEEQNSELNKSIMYKESRINFIDGEINRINKQNIEKKEEYDTLNNWIKLSHRYSNLERCKSDISKQIYTLKQDKEELDLDIIRIKRSLERKASNIESLRDTIKSHENNLKNLRNEDLYNEVKDQYPDRTDESKHFLIEERNRLKDIINKNNKDLMQLNEEIKKEKQVMFYLEKDLEILKKSTDSIIDEDLEFTSYGDEEIDKLINDKKKLEPEKRQVERELAEKEKTYKKTETELEIKVEEYGGYNFEIIEFKDPLNEVESSLDDEEKSIKIKEEKNRKIKESLEKQKTDIEACIHKLDISDARYGYNAESVGKIHLEESFYTEFPYNRKGLIEQLSSGLEELKNNKEQLKNNLNNEKYRYKNFCDKHIKDVKLREKAIAAIIQKNEYLEALEGQQNMKKIIGHSIKVLEDDIRDYNSDLEKFIKNLLVHLREVSNELNEIPKKTRIKIEGESKQIYQFSIPEWKEEEAKDDIRKYIDKMTVELDKEKFKNEDNTENKQTIRREVEKWLDTKSLLTIALKDSSIKIKCRKVSNDGKISNGLNSWESSNRWSGGEKWSKNTSLFLGILNYIAEKRGGIIAGLKTSRTVIMDNPFGKASSDHVLDPVFLIAEKLGFQIIALTAHAEGSFIRNYFPIVYSCRLRESINGESLIVDPEKQVKHAFFKDKDPHALSRIEDSKQISLFQ